MMLTHPACMMLTQPSQMMSVFFVIISFLCGSFTVAEAGDRCAGPAYNCDRMNPCDLECASEKSYYAGHTEMLYIECGTEGQCKESKCPRHTVWNQDSLECEAPNGFLSRCGKRHHHDCDLYNPCSPSKCESEVTRYTGSQDTRESTYIQCDTFYQGSCAEVSCDCGFTFNEDTRECEEKLGNGQPDCSFEDRISLLSGSFNLVGVDNLQRLAESLGWTPTTPRYILMAADGSAGRQLCLNITTDGNHLNLDHLMNRKHVYVERLVMGSTKLNIGAEKLPRYVTSQVDVSGVVTIRGQSAQNPTWTTLRKEGEQLYVTMASDTEELHQVFNITFGC